MSTFLAPRFVDLFQANPEKYGGSSNPLAWAATGATPFHSSPERREAAELVQHYKYWNYVAITRICDRFSEPFPCLGVKRRTKAGQQRHLGRQDRRWITQRYGGQWLQSIEDDIEPLPDGYPLIKLLEGVNFEDCWTEFAWETCLMLKLTGRFYWWAIPSGIRGQNGYALPAELHVVPTQWVEPRWDKSGRLTHYEVTPDGQIAQTIEIPAEDMITGKQKSPLSKIDAWSALRAAPMWTDNTEAIERSRNAAFKNGVNPDLVIELDGEKYKNPDEAVLQRIKEKFINRTAGVKRAGEPMLLPPGIKATKWSHTPREMDYQESGAQVRDNNLALHGVPPVVAGISSDYNRETANAANLVFCETTMNPLFRWFAAILTEKLAWRYDERIRAYYPDCRPHDAEQTLAEMKAAADNGAVFPDEWRQFLGYELTNRPAYQTGYVPVGKTALDPQETDEEDDAVEGDEGDEKPKKKPAAKGKTDDTEDDDEE